MSIFTITATGNFRYSEDSCQNLIDCVEAGIPVEIVPVTLMGLIAPVTTVGATVFHTIDVLAGITMAQVIRPGAPVLFGGAPATFHMKIASSPMAAIEALQLDAAYVAVAKALDLPCQSYMALSDGPILDAQAGAETFGSALIAALAGVNSVSGPGMLDFLLVFNLPKLVFDDEMCAQALRFVREIKIAEDLPVDALIDQLMADQHLIMADHTMAHWPEELYLPSSIVDRDNRENWTKAGGKDTAQRAADEVDRRLARYQPIETDPLIDAELQRIIRSGLEIADRAADAADRGPTRRRRRIGRASARQSPTRWSRVRLTYERFAVTTSMSVGQELLELGPVDWHVDVHAHPAAMTDVRRPEEPVRRRFDERLLGERRGRDPEGAAIVVMPVRRGRELAAVGREPGSLAVAQPFRDPGDGQARCRDPVVRAATLGRACPWRAQIARTRLFLASWVSSTSPSASSSGGRYIPNRPR